MQLLISTFRQHVLEKGSDKVGTQISRLPLLQSLVRMNNAEFSNNVSQAVNTRPSHPVTTMSSNAPIDQLPVEVLMSVFRLLLPEHLGPLQLVCRTWRDVLHNVSYLWTFIAIRRHPTLSPLDVLKLASKKVNRSGILPLTIYWRPDLKEEEITEDIKAAIMEFFKNAPIPRWHSLFLSDSTGFLDEILTTDTKFSSLQSLNLQIQTDPFNLEVLELINQTAASIEKLQVFGTWDVLEPYMTNIIHRVTNIEVYDEDLDLQLPGNVCQLTMASFPSNLRGMQHVLILAVERVECSLIDDVDLHDLIYLNVGSAVDNEDVDITLTFPNLLHLKFPHNAPFLLAHIHAPKLQHLQLQEPWPELVSEEEEINVPAPVEGYFFMLIGGFFPSIESLTLECYVFTELVSGMIRKAPKLRHVEMVLENLADAAIVLRPLVPFLPGGIVPDTPEELDWSVCPDLKSLTIRYQGTKESRPELETFCHTFIKFRRFLGLERLIIVYPDSTDRRTIVLESDEE